MRNYKYAIAIITIVITYINIYIYKKGTIKRKQIR